MANPLRTLLLTMALAVTLSACYAETRPAGDPSTASPGSASVQAPPPTAVSTPGYQAMVYQGYVVYYDAHGRPVYYLSGVQQPVPVTSPYHDYYVWYYQHHRAQYSRWYRTHGHRYRNWRQRHWRRHSRYWKQRVLTWRAKNRNWARRRAARVQGRVLALVPALRGSGPWTTRTRAKIRGRIYALKECYTRALATFPQLSGEVKVWFHIRPDGEVEGPRIVGDTIPPTMRACLRNRISRWQLGAVPHGIHYGPATLTFTQKPRPRRGGGAKAGEL